MIMLIYRGLIAITRNHNVRSLSIVNADNTLFTIQYISNIKFVSCIKKESIIQIDQDIEKYMIFLRGFISIINIVSQITQSRYYTFLGEFKYNIKKKLLKYEPYVDLMKKVTVRVSTKNVRILSGDVVKKFKKSKSGCTPGFLLSTFEDIVRKMVE